MKQDRILEKFKKNKTVGFWFNNETGNFEKPSRQEQSLIAQDPKGIKLSIFQRDLQLTAEVIIHHINLTTHNFSEYKRVIIGKHTEVLQETLKILKKDYQKEFLENWDKTIYRLYNKNLSNISTGNIFHNTKTNPEKINYGPFNIVSAGELLKKKIAESDSIENVEQLAAFTGINAATIYRQLDGSEIGREQALKYAQALGCDPAELLFNPIYIQTWGTVINDNYFYDKETDFGILPGEIVPREQNISVLCPREIYRPNIKAIYLKDDDKIALYYQSKNKNYKENELVIIGTKGLTKDDKPINKYYLGYINTDKDNCIKLTNFNHKLIDRVYKGYTEAAKDGAAGKDLLKTYDTFTKVIDEIPLDVITFIAPVVSILDHKKIEQKTSFKGINMIAAQEKMKDEQKKLEFKTYFSGLVEDTIQKTNKEIQDLKKNIEFIDKQLAETGLAKENNVKEDKESDYTFARKFPSMQRVAKYLKDNNVQKFSFKDFNKQDIDIIFGKGKDMKLYDIDYLYNQYGPQNIYVVKKLKESHWWKLQIIREMFDPTNPNFEAHKGYSNKRYNLYKDEIPTLEETESKKRA